jgi:phage shock protein PspC (stress-responsive transcriptional regulator)
MNKKLYRSSKDKMLGGVAAGLADYFNIDPTLVRVLFVVILFLGGTGILAYIIMWIIVPEEPFVFQTTAAGSSDKPETETTSEKQENSFDAQAYFNSVEKKREKRRTTAGLILLVLGLIFLADNFIPRINIGEFWPLILVAAGIGILLNSKNRTYNL